MLKGFDFSKIDLTVISGIKEKITSCIVIKKALDFVSEHKKAVKISAISVLGAASLLIAAAASGVTVGFNVKYSGKTIATVASYKDYRNAKNILRNNVFGADANSTISAAKLSVAFTFSDNFNNPDDVADAIISNSDNIVYGYGIVVDGKEVIVGESKVVDAVVDERLNQFYVEGADNEADFVKDVVFEEGYYTKSEISDISEIAKVVSKLDVKTVSNKVTDTIIPYSTKTVKTNKQDVTYNEVTTAGQNGISRKKERIETVNGTEISHILISDEVVSSPVTEIVTVGTAPVTKTDRSRSAARSAGFIFPLGSSYNVSAYWGDGRGHKGIDLATNKGNPIYAVAAGTVTFSGYDGAYGYSVVIDHGNGLSTRYAHASALYAQKGDRVSQGDVIAAVGRTGSATGNHLHFEVIVNGTRVNPAPYISIG